MYVVNKFGLYVFFGRLVFLVNIRSVFVIFFVNKKFGMFLVINNGKFESVFTVKIENVYSYGIVIKEFCKIFFLKVEYNNSCFIFGFCFSIGNCVNMKICLENILLLKGFYIIKILVNFLVKVVFNILFE